MGVRKLETFIESPQTPSSVFKKNVKIEELKDTYLKDHPGSKVELLFDLECCMYHMFPQDRVNAKYGGEYSNVVEILRDFYEKFSKVGIKVIAFFGNSKSKDRRSQWIERRYNDVTKVNEFMRYNESLRKMPSDLEDTVAAVILFVLKETIVHSLTENDNEIIAYAKKHKSFGILSQDTDYVIANAAQYYLPMRDLRLQDMTTSTYDSRGLANYLQLQVNQLPLFATLMGNDVMDYDTMKGFHRQIMRSGRDRIFVLNIASRCRPVRCDQDGHPLDNKQLIDFSKQISNGSHTKVYSLMVESIASYFSYAVEEDLLIDKMKSDEKDILSLAITLYRQCLITSDVLMLLCTKELKMSTSIEIFNDGNIKPIGHVLANLRRVLYGAMFQGDQTVRIKEYVITGSGCLPGGIPPKVAPAELKSVQRLGDVWRKSLKPGQSKMNKVWELLTESVSVDDHLWERVPEHTEEMREYFISIVAQSCDMKPNVVEKLLEILPGLPSEVHVPLFAFLYLDHEPGAFLSSSERDAVLFTFSLVSVLSSSQLHTFLELFSGNSVSTCSKYSKSNPLIRAANLFMKATHHIIELNAVCGFPIPLEAVNVHNYWQASIVEIFHQWLNVDKKTTLELVEKLYSCLNNERIAKDSFSKSSLPGDQFADVLRGCEAIGLIDNTVYKKFIELMTPPSSEGVLNLKTLQDEIDQIAVGS